MTRLASVGFLAGRSGTLCLLALSALAGCVGSRAPSVAGVSPMSAPQSADAATMTAMHADVELERAPQPAPPRTFQAQWFGGAKSVEANEAVQSPSAGFPGAIGVRFPEVRTDRTTNPNPAPQFEATSDILLRRGTATISAAGALTLQSGVIFALSDTEEVVPGTTPPTAFLYPVVVTTSQGVQSGTVGTDWLCYGYQRPKSGGGTEQVLLVCMIKSSNAVKGVWMRWNGNASSATITTEMTFVEFVDGARTVWPPAPVNLSCDATDQSPACLVGRVLLDAIQSAKLSGMIPESYQLPAPPAQ